LTNYKENGVLVYCDECIVNILRKVNEKTEFEIRDIQNDLLKSRKEVLEFIISVMYYNSDYTRTPRACRTEITNLLRDHGQFTEEEINIIFEEKSYKELIYYSEEFIAAHPEIDYRDQIAKMWENPFDTEKILQEEMYSFSHYSCDYKEERGFCKIQVEEYICPDCGSVVFNTPENIDGNTQSLVCHKCQNKNSNGIIISGNPLHHGSWDSQAPEFEYTGTDYFFILHPNCKESKRLDGKGPMFVNGLWADSSSDSQKRIVLSLECIWCGERNAIKPWLLNKYLPETNIPILDLYEDVVLQKIKGGENHSTEFKPYIENAPVEYENSFSQKEKVIKSVAGFLNSEGGTLFIGVSDSGRILGIEQEYLSSDFDEIIGNNMLQRDKFGLSLIQILETKIERDFLKRFVNISFYNLYGKDICAIKIQKADRPCYVAQSDFFVRIFASTRILKDEQKSEYIASKWPSTL
jgi:hypothetical protein